MNLFGIKRYLIALFPLAIIVLVFQWHCREAFLYRSGIGRVNFAAMARRILLIQTKTHQSLFIYEHEDEGDDDNPHHGKPSAHSSGWRAVWLLIHLIAVIAYQNECQPAGGVADQHERGRATGFGRVVNSLAGRTGRAEGGTE